MPIHASARSSVRYGLLPGLLASAVMALLAFSIGCLPGAAYLSPMIVAILIGMAVANLGHVPGGWAPGLGFAVRPLLRTAIVLLGLRVTLGDLMALGWSSLAAVVSTLLLTYVFTVRIGRLMGLSERVSSLVAAGTSVCGASAVVAMNSVVDGSKEDVAHAIAAVTVFGTLSMFLFPVLGPLLELDPRSFGLWSGLSIHEIAQVIAAGFQAGPEAGEVATVSKLARVALLAPLVIGVGHLHARDAEEGTPRPPFPWFVVGFLAMVVLGGLVRPSPAVLSVATTITTALFTMALAAMGSMVDLRRLLHDGWRPIALGAVAWIFVSLIALAWVEVLARSWI